MTQEYPTMTETVQDVLNEMPKASARGAQLITDALTMEMMLEVNGLGQMEQCQFWAGALFALTANIKAATHEELAKLLLKKVLKELM